MASETKLAHGVKMSMPEDGDTDPGPAFVELIMLAMHGQSAGTALNVAFNIYARVFGQLLLAPEHREKAIEDIAGLSDSVRTAADASAALLMEERATTAEAGRG
jgi:hypothetical protein